MVSRGAVVAKADPSRIGNCYGAEVPGLVGADGAAGGRSETPGYPIGFLFRLPWRQLHDNGPTRGPVVEMQLERLVAIVEYLDLAVRAGQ